MNITQQVVILSAERSELGAAENLNRTNILRGCIDDIGLKFSQAIGVYKGKEEMSFVVLINTLDDIENLKSFAFNNFDQESVLYQDANQEAYLLFGDGTEQRLGVLERTNKDDAIIRDAYTILNGEYYVTNKRKVTS